MAVKRKEKEPDKPIKGSAEALFLELMMQMLAFFILLTSMAVIVDDKRMAALGSLAGTFSLMPEGANLGKGNGPALPAQEIVPGRNTPRRTAKELTDLAKSLGMEGSIFILPLDRETVSVRLPEKILFAQGGVELSPKLGPFLDKFAALLHKPEVIQITIEGHTDATPTHSSRYLSNWELSAGRAMSVFHALSSRGVPNGRMIAVGMGDQHLLPASSPGGTHRDNRRVELLIKFRPVTSKGETKDRSGPAYSPQRPTTSTGGQ